jgi:hypothetical protein
MLTKMEPMGGRKPSQLLHAMLEYCPVGMEKHLSFHYFFMQRLPQAQRTQLGEGEAEENAPVSIAALRGGTRGRGGNSRGQVGGQRA